MTNSAPDLIFVNCIDQRQTTLNTIAVFLLGTSGWGQLLRFLDHGGHVATIWNLVEHLMSIRDPVEHLASIGDNWGHVGSIRDHWGHVGSIRDHWGHVGSIGDR